MREINDNLYVFSISGHSKGKIIACRTRDGTADGENIFDKFGMSDNEQAFFEQALARGVRKPIILSGKKTGNATAIVVMSLTENRTLFYIACELYDDPVFCVRSIIEIFSHEVVVSDEANRLFFDVRNKFKCDILRFLSISSSLRDMFLMCAESESISEPIFEILEMSRIAAAISGVELAYSFCERDEGERLGTVFARGLYAEVITVLSIVARSASKNRAMSVDIVQFENSACVNISFDIFDRISPFSEEYIKLTASENDIPISYRCENGRYICSVTPFLCDVALSGLKQN